MLNSTADILIGHLMLKMMMMMMMTFIDLTSAETENPSYQVSG